MINYKYVIHEYDEETKSFKKKLRVTTPLDEAIALAFSLATTDVEGESYVPWVVRVDPGTADGPGVWLVKRYVRGRLQGSSRWRVKEG